VRWSVRLGSLFGIPVYLHLTFLVLLFFVAFSQGVRGGSLSAAVSGVVFVASIFGCVVLHEFGHALAARRFGIETRDVTLLPIGGVARLERMPEDPKQEIWVALAGPAVNVAIAGLLGIWIFLVGIGSLNGFSLFGGSLALRLMAVNIGLVVFNLLPAFPMDGGRVLRAALAHRMSHTRATVLAANVGKAMAALFAILGLLWNPMLVLIAMFVWIGAGQEAAFAKRREAFARARPFPWRQAGRPVDLGPAADGTWTANPDPDRPRGRHRVRRVGPWLIDLDERGSDD